MNKLNEIADLGLRITWRLITIGLYGESYIKKQLSKEDIFEYLYDLLDIETDETDNIIKLICEKENDSKIDKFMHTFAEKEQTDLTIQLRKWRVYLLKKMLDNINQNCLRGLLELIEFWTAFEIPEESPHTDPKPGNLKEYFTQDVFNSLLEKNKQWAKDEIERIKLLEK